MQGNATFAVVLMLTFSSLATAAQSPAAQDSAPGVTASDATEIKQALAQTQAMLREQQEAMRQMQQQLAEQAREIAALRAQQHAASDVAASGAEQLQASVAALRAPAAETLTAQQRPSPHAAPAPGLTETHPGELYFRLGSATFTPSGWVDFTAYFRSTNVGSGLGTNFATIPYNNVVQGGQSEVRFSSQSSRIGMRVDQSMGKMKGYGYLEADFNGALPGNAYVSTNPNSLRMRVYYVNLTRAKWELLGGQAWSLMTPTRKALSPFLADLFNTFHLDTNYQVGLPYARQTQFRVVYHPLQSVAAGLSVENAEQFSGAAVTFPSAFSNTETDINSSSGSGGGTATPNVHPDVIAKATFDRKVNGRTYHVGVAGLLTATRVFTPPAVTKAEGRKDEREGGAVLFNASLDLMKRFRMIALAYWSDGGGRYLGGMGPGFVVLQPGTATSPFRAALIHSGSGIGGFEVMPTRTTTVSGYVSAAYFQRRYGRDPSATTPTWVGYGFPGSSNAHNRILEEVSLASTTTFWQRPGYGALQLITQTSYVRRAPWYVATGAPKDAHTFMEYTSLRYVIP